MKSNIDNRRKALKTLAVGAPVVWAKPVVDSVVLPAHGEGSPGKGEDIDLLCCTSATDGSSEGVLALIDGQVQGEIGSCFPTCDGANIQLVQGQSTLDVFTSGCRDDISGCTDVGCTVVGSGLSCEIGSNCTLFPGSEGAGLQIGVATLRLLSNAGNCEFGINLVGPN